MRKHLPVIECSGLSHTGPVREDNQDTIHLPNGLHSPEAGLLYAVADGMGGYSQGALASSLAVQTLIEVIYGGKARPNPRNLKRGIESANIRIYKKAEQLGTGRMGTTLTAAYIFYDKLHLLHVGDSRAYLIRDQRAKCLTPDHTLVGDLVRSKIISADKVRNHHQRSILTRSVGIGLFVRPDISQLRLLEKDHVVLCSDGVWSVIQDDEFAQVVTESNGIDQVSENLIHLALDRGTDDNASVVAIHVREL